MKTAYHEIMAGASVPVDKNTKTWNDLCRDVMRELAPVVDVATLKKCVVHHFLEELLVSSYEISLQYLNALFAHAPADEFDRSAREYFESQILKNSKHAGEEGILMLNVHTEAGVQLVVRKNAASAWAAAPSSFEWRPYLPEIAAMMPRESTLAEIIGYIVEFKEKSGGSYAVFKIKYVQEKGVGARCDQISSKQRRLTIVNQIMHGLEPAADVVPIYTMESTKNQNTARFCVLPEMLLRSYNLAHKDGKHWFLTPVQAARSAMKPK
jgi:hypothetical protein